MAQKKHNMLQLTLDLKRYFSDLYREAASDFDISGGLDALEDDGDDLILYLHEDDLKFAARFSNFNDYTAEQLFDAFLTGKWEEEIMEEQP